MTTFLIVNATVLSVDQNNTVFEGGWLAVEEGRIAALGPAGEEPAGYATVHDLQGHLVMPGFVNAHTHTPMILFRGVAEGQSLLTMEGWYNAIREPELSMEGEDVPPAVALSCAEMLLSGTTTFCEQYFFAEELAGAVRESGMRAVIAYGIVQLGDAEIGARELARAEAFLAQQRSPDGRVIPWFGPHAPYVDNTAELLLEEVQIANRYGSGLHLHMACGPEDNAYALEHYGTTTTVALEKTGFFAGRVHAAHCLDLTEEDIAVFARAPAASIAYCASAGLRSGRAGICPAVDLRNAGVTVALGTDNVAANNSYDMVQEMRVAGLVASHREGVAQVLDSQTLVRMATIEGARALGLEQEIGSLEVGKSADIIAIDMRGPGWSPAPDVETLLVYSGSGRDVRNVWVAGEALVVNRELVRTSYETVRNDYTRAYDQFWAKVRAAKAKVN